MCVAPSAPSIKGTMTLSYCSLCLFYLPENLKAAISVYFWYRIVPIFVSYERKLVRPGIIIIRRYRGGGL
jgi:hypothetical protein